MRDKALETVMMRNSFYRDNYRRLVGAVLLMLLINIGLAVLIFYLVVNRPPPQYFATTDQGRIIPLYPLSVPVKSQEELLQWATQAAVSAYTYNFVNYRKELQKTSDYFTPEGWKEFEVGLKRSRNLETVIKLKLIANAVPTGAPVITERGVIQGRYTWRVQLPLLVTFQSASQTIQQTVVVNMLVTRVPTLNDPRGIAIANFYAQESQRRGG